MAAGITRLNCSRSSVKDLRRALATELARYFFHHVRVELGKPDALQAQISYDGRTSGEVNGDIYARLLALRDNSAESNLRFKDVTLDNFKQFEYHQTGFSISFLIRVENNMREMVREIMLTIPGIDHTEGCNIINTASLSGEYL